MIKIKSLTIVRKGYTLIELIVVIAIIAILATTIIIGTTALINYSKAAADNASLRILRDATQFYGKGMATPSEDVFDGISADSDRMNKLISEGYLQAVITPQTENKQFRWQTSMQEWTIENSNTIINGSFITMGTGGQRGYIKGTYTGSAKDIVIPTKIDGVIATNIYQDVFSGKDLTSITFDASSMIVQIHARAFNKNKLTEIKFPDSLKRIDYGAFNNNPIVKITIGAGVVMESNAFQNNNSFKDSYASGGAGTYLFVDGKWIKQ